MLLYFMSLYCFILGIIYIDPCVCGYMYIVFAACKSRSMSTRGHHVFPPGKFVIARSPRISQVLGVEHGCLSAVLLYSAARWGGPQVSARAACFGDKDGDSPKLWPKKVCVCVYARYQVHYELWMHLLDSVTVSELCSPILLWGHQVCKLRGVKPVHSSHFKMLKKADDSHGITQPMACWWHGCLFVATSSFAIQRASDQLSIDL